MMGSRMGRWRWRRLIVSVPVTMAWRRRLVVGRWMRWGRLMVGVRCRAVVLTAAGPGQGRRE